MNGKVYIGVLKERICEKYDPDALVDILGITSADLLEMFEDRMMECRSLFSELEDCDD